MAKVRIDFEAKTSGAHAALRKLEGGFSAMKRKLSGIGSGLKSAGGALIAFLGVQMGIGAVKKLIDDLDNLGKKARNMNLSTDELQKFEYAAKSVNFPVEQLQPNLDKMRKLIGEASRGSATAAETLGRLGLKAEDLMKLDTSGQLEAISGAMGDIENPTERAAAAMSVFGEQGGKFQEFLSVYAEKGREIEENGGLIDASQIQAAEDFNQACTDIFTALRSWAVDSGFLEDLKTAVEMLTFITGSMDEMSEKKGARNSVYTRHSGIEMALKKAEASGKYSKDEINWARVSMHNYASRVSMPADGTGYLTIDKALKEAGLGALARTKTASEMGFWERRFGDQFAGATDIASVKLSVPEQKEEVKKYTAKKKAAEEKKAADRANREAVRKATAEAKAAAEAKKAADAKQKQDDAAEAALQAQIDLMAEQYRQTQLILQGKARAVKIEREIAAAERALNGTRTLTDEEKAKISDLAGKMYDAEQKPEKQEKDRFVASDLTTPDFTGFQSDALLAIGGRLAGMRNGFSGTTDYTKVSAEKLASISTRLEMLEDKIPGRLEAKEATF